jgi:hypothetical protein
MLIVDLTQKSWTLSLVCALTACTPPNYDRFNAPLKLLYKLSTWSMFAKMS